MFFHVNARGGQAPALRARKVLLSMRRSGAGAPELQSPAPAWLSEGQALALRCKGPFFIVARGPVPRVRAHAPDL